MNDDTDTPTTEIDTPLPIVVNPGNAAALTMQTLRQLALIASGSMTLLGLLGTRDVAGFLAFVQSSDMVTLGAAVVTIATMAWGWARTVWNKAKLVTAAAAAPDEVAIVAPVAR